MPATPTIDRESAQDQDLDVDLTDPVASTSRPVSSWRPSHVLPQPLASRARLRRRASSLVSYSATVNRWRYAPATGGSFAVPCGIPYAP